MINRNRPAAHQEIIQRGRHDAAVRNFIKLLRPEHPQIGTCSARIVDVDRIIDPGNRIGKPRTPHKSIDRKVLKTENPARFPHTDLRSDRVDFRLLIYTDLP